jgi:hypothetical protein
MRTHCLGHSFCIRNVDQLWVVLEDGLGDFSRQIMTWPTEGLPDCPGFHRQALIRFCIPLAQCLAYRLRVSRRKTGDTIVVSGRLPRFLRLDAF